MSDTEVKQTTRPVLNIEPPKDYKVIYLNDDVTTYEFVISSLMNTFDYDESNASDKSQEIDEKVPALLQYCHLRLQNKKVLKYY